MTYYNGKLCNFSIPALSGNGNLSSPDFQTILVLDQSEYDALDKKSPEVLYLIRG